MTAGIAKREIASGGTASHDVSLASCSLSFSSDLLAALRQFLAGLTPGE
jgi:hypothetical protein